MARQFNLIPPVCEQAEYHLFQREKVEVQLPELYHKIGKSSVCVCCVVLCRISQSMPDNEMSGPMTSYHKHPMVRTLLHSVCHK